MKDVRITKASGTWDVSLTNGLFDWAEDGTQAAQHSTIRLMIFKGEYSLDGMLTTKTELGTKWYEVVFDMSLAKVEKEFEIKRRLLGTPGIQKITKWNWTQTANSVTIDGQGVTDWGEEVDLSQDIEVL